MRIEQTVVMDQVWADEIVTLLQNSGWRIQLDAIDCLFASDLTVGLTDSGNIRIEYVGLDCVRIDHEIPTDGKTRAKATFIGPYGWRTLKIEWDERWDHELTVTRCLVLVHDEMTQVEL